MSSFSLAFVCEVVVMEEFSGNVVGGGGKGDALVNASDAGCVVVVVLGGSKSAPAAESFCSAFIVVWRVFT